VAAAPPAPAGSGVAAWELNMRALKAAARDLDRLPAEVLGGCHSRLTRLGGACARTQSHMC
jgi:hypothetical protein